jgi:LPXTG-site transpeptidase (sortase) family protein
MAKKDLKGILKVVVLVYFASFFVINWNNVSWIFNYKEVSGLISDFFNPFPSIDASTIKAGYFTTKPTVKTIAQSESNSLWTPTNKINSLDIPGISVTAPIVFSTSTDKSLLSKDLEKGVVYYPGSVKPGQAGQIVILGHSAPLGWPKVKYDWIFSDINNLSIGDAIYISLNNKQYKYTVKQKIVIARGVEIPSSNFPANSSVLTLISCWPPGKDYQRITVTATIDNISI